MSKALQKYGLTQKELAFCDEYIKNEFNGTRAALEVYNFNSDNAASTYACNLLKKDKIQDFLKERKEAILGQLKLDRNHRLKRLAQIFYDDDKRAAISASKEINKMLGDYAPEKYQNLSPNDSVNQVVKELRVVQEMKND